MREEGRKNNAESETFNLFQLRNIHVDALRHGKAKQLGCNSGKLTLTYSWPPLNPANQPFGDLHK